VHSHNRTSDDFTTPAVHSGLVRGWFVGG